MKKPPLGSFGLFNKTVVKPSDESTGFWGREVFLCRQYSVKQKRTRLFVSFKKPVKNWQSKNSTDSHVAHHVRMVGRMESIHLLTESPKFRTFHEFFPKRRVWDMFQSVQKFIEAI